MEASLYGKIFEALLQDSAKQYLEHAFFFLHEDIAMHPLKVDMSRFKKEIKR